MNNSPEHGGEQDQERAAAALESTPDFSRILTEVTSGYPIRQQVIQRIQGLTGRKMIAYVAHLGAPIGPDDVTPFASVLGPLGDYLGLDILIQSGGGDADTAEKLLYMARSFTEYRELRLIVPNHAKSAATMLGLGCDQIVMGYTSELGPIDPQIPQPLPGGGIRWTPAQSFLDSFNSIKDEVERTGRLNPALIPILNNVDLAFLDAVEKSIKRSRSFAETWLPRYMLRARQDDVQRVADSLLNVEKYLSHGQIINAEEARSIGLEVEYLGPAEPLWQLFWEYYCRAEVFLRQTQQVKLFESDAVSVAIRAG
jgi:hypothetical protein